VPPFQPQCSHSRESIEYLLGLEFADAASVLQGQSQRLGGRHRSAQPGRHGLFLDLLHSFAADARFRKYLFASTSEATCEQKAGTSTFRGGHDRTIGLRSPMSVNLTSSLRRVTALAGVLRRSIRMACPVPFLPGSLPRSRCCSVSDFCPHLYVDPALFTLPTANFAATTDHPTGFSANHSTPQRNSDRYRTGRPF